jgi:hypothetical protein
MKSLPNNFYAFPKIAHTTMDSKNLKELLLSVGSDVIINVRLWDIISKHIGAGVYRVSLKLKN